MTVLRDADGRPIGEGGCGRLLCHKGANDRRRFGCQTPSMDAVNRADPTNSRLIPHCPKTCGFRQRVGCEVTADGALIKSSAEDAKPRGETTMPRRHAMDANTLRIMNGTLRRYGVKLAADGETLPLDPEKDLDHSLPQRVLDACSSAALGADDLSALITLFRDAGYDVDESAMDNDAPSQSDMIRMQRAGSASAAAMDAGTRSFAKEVTKHIRVLDGGVAEDRRRQPKAKGDWEDFYRTYPDARSVKNLG